MPTRVSAQELHLLRNSIPILWLITNILKLQTILTDGIVRFQCPYCMRFDTKTNPKTNLARCFECQKNFNSIDIIMCVKKTSFLLAVKYLQKCLTLLPPTNITKQHNHAILKSQNNNRSSSDSKQLVKLSQILNQYKIN